MASPAEPIAERRTHLSLPSDEILEEIFLRLPAPESLARASAVCAAFRRVVTDRLFLRRYRKLRPPPLLGLISDRDGGFHPAQPPHPSARLARALLDAADFTYAFVPKPEQGWLSPWHPRDVRDGRVLLDCRVPGKTVRTAFAVCDPVFRHYVVLPPVPEELIAAHDDGRPAELAPVLAPVAEDEDERSFKVICMAHYETRLVAFVFSSVARRWCVAASPSWSSLGTGRPRGWRNSSDSDGCRGLSSFDCVRGCFYSASPWLDKLLVLDARRMEFSVIHDRDGLYKMLRNLADIPAGQFHLQHGRRRPGETRSLPGVVGREGALEVFYLVGANNPNVPTLLYHSSQQSNDDSFKCRWMNIIPLCGPYDYFTVGATERFLFLGATKEDQTGQYHVDMVVAHEDHYNETPPLETWDVDYFSLELRTSELEKICTMKKPYFNHERVHSYFGFPPSLSTPSI